MIPFARAEVVYASDIQFELIELLKKIRDCPKEVANGYASRWARLQQEGHSAYYEIRADFNSKRDPFDLLFLSRTCVNGLIRFNRNGDFNNSLHHTRPGIHPERLRAIAQQWSLFLQGAELTRRDYRDVIREARSDDFFFLDPPYANNRGRYQPGTFDPRTLHGALAHLNRVGARWLLTFDGTAGSRNYDDGIPPDLYEFIAGSKHGTIAVHPAHGFRTR